ncbi:copine-8-like isoform X2 [Tubulanus polymorphus]|uniref:copine-8-like isoform X2 n=1 Tax=Tubulanus polymorphus TaxID=672921 RepID=UPI003DA497DC
MAAFAPGQAVANPSSLVEVSVSCRNLVDMDVFSKSDPICVLFTYEIPSGWKEFGRTEIIWDNLNPDFVKKFVLNYFFEEQQRLKFELYDVDSKSHDLSKHDFLGSMECTLGEIVTTNRLQQPLKGPKVNSGSIVSVRAEELGTCKEQITLQFCGKKLDKKDFFGKSDPFLLFHKSNEDSSFTVTHRTEHIKKTLNPTWKPFTMPITKLCNGDYDRLIKVECFDWDRDGGHDLIGEFSTTIRELTRGPGQANVYECIHPKKKAKKKSYKHSGLVELLSCKVETVPSFLDFIKGGTEISATIAIDFTASNGDPRQPSSLHYYMDPYRPSQYAIALKAVGEIIEDYDTDKLFPALGFGARIPPDGVVSHEFFLNGHPTNPYCQGVSGVMEAYHRSLNSVQLYGPTNFAPIINHVARFAAACRDGSGYFILLLLTDGVITDLPQTKEAIVSASHLPLSIIIVGVGDADFTAMDVLDGDDERLSSKGRYAERDIVQFVPMRDFLHASRQNVDVSKARLAKAVLEEVPDQLLSYMKKNRIEPKPQLQKLPPLPSVYVPENVK